MTTCPRVVGASEDGRSLVTCGRPIANDAHACFEHDDD